MSIDDTITISRDAYRGLLEDRTRLDALYAAGVDNWSGHDYAMELLHADDEDDA